MNTITPMRAWMAAATPDEQKLLAERVGTTRGHLYQLAGGHRQCSSAMAGRIESVTSEMARASRNRLPRVVRTDLCAACRACPYAAKCLGERAVVSDFPIVDPRQLEIPL